METNNEQKKEKIDNKVYCAYPLGYEPYPGPLGKTLIRTL